MLCLYDIAQHHNSGHIKDFKVSATSIKCNENLCYKV